jgi:molybdopterin biosynthesis enzyme MoaB
MAFKYTNVNVISIIPKNIDISIYRKFQYRVIGIYKKTIIIDIPQQPSYTSYIMNIIFELFLACERPVLCLMDS